MQLTNVPSVVLITAYDPDTPLSSFATNASDLIEVSFLFTAKHSLLMVLRHVYEDNEIPRDLEDFLISFSDEFGFTLSVISLKDSVKASMNTDRFDFISSNCGKCGSKVSFTVRTHTELPEGSPFPMESVSRTIYEHSSPMKVYNSFKDMYSDHIPAIVLFDPDGLSHS